MAHSSSVFSFRQTQIVIFCIMLFCAWLPVASAVSIAHQPLPIQCNAHQPLNTATDSTDSTTQQIAGHSHGHISFDPTHDLPQWIATSATVNESAHVTWPRSHQAQPQSASISPAKKPPKRQFIV